MLCEHAYITRGCHDNDGDLRAFESPGEFGPGFEGPLLLSMRAVPVRIWHDRTCSSRATPQIADFALKTQLKRTRSPSRRALKWLANEKLRAILLRLLRRAEAQTSD